MTEIPTILITDMNCNIVADPLNGWSELDINRKFNEPASGAFRVPGSEAVFNAIQPGRRVVILRRGEVFVSGPIERIEFNGSAEEGGPGEMQVNFVEDLVHVVGRVTWPSPTSAITSQGNLWTATNTNAETVMRNLVNLNAGPAANTDRVTPKLILGAVAGVGTNITINTRYEPMGDVLRRAAEAGGGLGFRTQQVGTDIEFTVYAPEDKSGSVRFSRSLGNLRSLTFERECPDATSAVVGGSGEGAARTMIWVVGLSADEWFNVERFVDQRQTTDNNELTAAGIAEVEANATEKVRIATVTVDTPTQAYGVHYNLGDKVSVELFPGFQITDVVRSIHYQCSPTSGEVITVIVGSQSATSDFGSILQAREFSRRFARVEGV